MSSLSNAHSTRKHMVKMPSDQSGFAADRQQRLECAGGAGTGRRYGVNGAVALQRTSSSGRPWVFQRRRGTVIGIVSN